MKQTGAPASSPHARHAKRRWRTGVRASRLLDGRDGRPQEGCAVAASSRRAVSLSSLGRHVSASRTSPESDRPAGAAAPVSGRSESFPSAGIQRSNSRLWFEYKLTSKAY